MKGLESVLLTMGWIPLGNHWGSKYINDALQRKVLSILQDETYLETDGKTLRDIVNRSVMYQFETETKEGFRNEEDEVFEIDGLRENPEKQFERSQLKVSRLVESLSCQCYLGTFS